MYVRTDAKCDMCVAGQFDQSMRLVGLVPGGAHHQLVGCGLWTLNASDFFKPYRCYDQLFTSHWREAWIMKLGGSLIVNDRPYMPTARCRWSGRINWPALVCKSRIELLGSDVVSQQKVS